MKRNILSIISVLMLITCICGCAPTATESPKQSSSPSAEPSPSATPEPEFTMADFTVVYPKFSILTGTTLEDAAFELCDAIKNKTGIDCDILEEASDNESTYEILIGNTSRVQGEFIADLRLRYNDFVIKYTDSKVVIAGGSAESTVLAVKYFTQNLLKESWSTVSGAKEIAGLDYTHTENTNIGRLSIAGTYITEFKVVSSLGNRETGVFISNIFTCAGEKIKTSTSNNQYEILIGECDREEYKQVEAKLLDKDYAIEVVGTKLVIAGKSTQTLNQALSVFYSDYLGKQAETLDITTDMNFLYNANYPICSLKLCGYDIADFVIVANAHSMGTARMLQNKIKEITGKIVTIVTNGAESHKKAIVLCKESVDAKVGELLSSLDGNTAIIKSEGSKIYLGSGSTNYYDSPAISYFVNDILGYDSYTNTAKSSTVNIEVLDNTLQIKDFVEKNYKEADNEQIAQWRKLTDERIESIQNSPNMEIPANATVYYISPNGNNANDGKTPETAWKTLTKLKNDFASGTYICFERGGLWRGQITAQKGVTYTAYGVGEKPKIYGSPFDGANASLWTKTDAENIWSIEMTCEDVGTLVFNHGEAHAIKCIIRTENDGSTYNNTTGEVFNSYADLTTDLHFYHDGDILYLYSEQNPGERFSSIEFSAHGHAFSVDGDNVTIDNLCIKYTGSHGVGAGTVNNLTVQNCEFGWIGGSIQKVFENDNYATRYGNAVEIYGGCDVFNVTDNYIYQVYDAGITQQINNSDPVYQKNMNYSRNVIEYCNYSIEYFITCSETNPSRMENFLIEDNYMWYAGMGLCEQRPNKHAAAHIKGWAYPWCNRATNYSVKNNLFLYSKDMLVEIGAHFMNPDGTNSMPTLENNQFLGKAGQQFGIAQQNSDTRHAYNKEVIDYLGSMCVGDIFWYYND